jgi:transcriptional regulator with XRE-family HTH domain
VYLRYHLYAMSESARLLATTRREVGLTQAELARRLGTTQSAIARLERRGSNPTVATLDGALRAMGRRLELASAERPPNIDETLLVSNLRRTPAERLHRFTSWHRSITQMREAARRSREQAS